MKKLSGRQTVLVGLTLFSMFFGAGNLIFPPFLGALAGTNTWPAMAGFALSAVGLPILGVSAVAKSGGLDVLAGRVHGKFAFIFTLLIYLSIGPCLAIPRTASTSFEMAVVPFAGPDVPVLMARAVYSAVFFGIAFLVALKPDKLTERLGKIMTPCLLTLIFVIFAGCVLHPAGVYGRPVEPYTGNSVIKGFLEGYLTMDTIAALNFGIIISLNIRAFGIEQEGAVVRETIKAGVVAGTVLILVYSVLAHIGALTGDTFGVMENGARTLAATVQFLFGKFGLVLLALIFFIACLNTCIGLLSCCSKYFGTIIPWIGYKAWVGIFAGVSLVISNIGLNKILEVSVPVLNALYPIAIVLIILAFTCPGRFYSVYRGSILLTGITSVTHALADVGMKIPVLSGWIEGLPLYRLGLEWVVPAAVGALTGILYLWYTLVYESKR